MSNPADKITAELMALADAMTLEAVKAHMRAASTGIPGLGAFDDRRRALEHAIRRAVDWGEPVAFSAEPDLRIDGLEAEMFLVSRAKEADYPVPLYAGSQA